jgi:death-on-curing protein
MRVAVRFLTMSEVLLILQDQIRRYGGTYGVRDLGLLSSALAMPSASFQGKYLHKDLFEQAAAYAFHLCQNHPFVDGNKRTGLASALVFLSLNGVELDDPTERLYGLMVEVAGKGKGKAEIAAEFRRLQAKGRRRK